MASRLFVGLAFAILALGFVLLYLDPEITGFVSSDSWIINTNLSATENGFFTLLEQNNMDPIQLRSLKINGQVTGSGNAKVYLLTDSGERVLVFDSDAELSNPVAITGQTSKSGSDNREVTSTTNNVQSRIFYSECVDTCFFESFYLNNLDVVIETDPGTYIEIKSFILE
ncbi:MAG: hypothetical protein U9R08_04620 [Nanoarchaeota archaeon]|nr:hypothetical protein [Nanoarchaeota archaeon]